MYPFEMSYSMSYKCLCIYHHYQDTERFHHPQRLPWVPFSASTPPLPPSRHPLTHFLSLEIRFTCSMPDRSSLAPDFLHSAYESQSPPIITSLGRLFLCGAESVGQIADGWPLPRVQYCVQSTAPMNKAAVDTGRVFVCRDGLIAPALAPRWGLAGF